MRYQSSVAFRLKYATLPCSLLPRFCVVLLDCPLSVHRTRISPCWLISISSEFDVVLQLVLTRFQYCRNFHPALLSLHHRPMHFPTSTTALLQPRSVALYQFDSNSSYQHCSHYIHFHLRRYAEIKFVQLLYMYLPIFLRGPYFQCLIRSPS